VDVSVVLKWYVFKLHQGLIQLVRDMVSSLHCWLLSEPCEQYARVSLSLPLRESAALSLCSIGSCVYLPSIALLFVGTSSLYVADILITFCFRIISV
jgi:hypothetical protein